MPTKPYIVTVADIKRESPAFGGSASGMMMDDHFVRWSWLDSAKSVEAAPAGYDQMTYVLEGQTTWTVDGEAYEVAAGNVLYIPAGAERSATGSGAHVLEVIGGLPWNMIDLAEHQIEAEYRNWVQDNK